MLEQQVIVGEALAGEAAQALKEVKQLVKNLSVNTFDLAGALHKVRKNKFYAPKFSTFAEYANSLDIKPSKCYYLVKLVAAMEQCGIPRNIYEPLGIAKLRVITRLEVTDNEGKDTLFEGVPVKLLVKDMIEKADTWDTEALELRVKQIQGLVGDNASAGWVNFPVTFAQRAKWEEAVALALKHIGSVGKDENTGQYKDASLGAAAEIIAVNFLLDPNYAEDEDEIPNPDSDSLGGESAGTEPSRIDSSGSIPEL